jgi:hypothetical protein
MVAAYHIEALTAGPCEGTIFVHVTTRVAAGNMPRFFIYASLYTVWRTCPLFFRELSSLLTVKTLTGTSLVVNEK